MSENKNDYTITKSTVECYKLRHSNGMYWADITLDSNETKGRIQIASDFGDWQNYWGACSDSFKSFLTRIDKYYAAGKFGCDRHFKFEETIQSFKERVIENRKISVLDHEQAREIFREIKEIETECSDNENEFVRFLESHCSNLMKSYDYMPDLRHGLSPGFEKFWNGPWQEFIAELKNELKQTAETIA